MSHCFCLQRFGRNFNESINCIYLFIIYFKCKIAACGHHRITVVYSSVQYSSVTKRVGTVVTGKSLSFRDRMSVISGTVGLL